MTYPVKLLLFNNNHLFQEVIAENENDLKCPIEMDTGTGWLDAAGLYQKLLHKQKPVTEVFKVCNSFEKWGAMQQEVVKIKVKMELIHDDSSNNLKNNNSDFLEPMRKAQVEKLQRQIDPNQSRAMYWIVIGIVLGGLSFCMPYILEM
jgi:hypothetical protein